MPGILVLRGGGPSKDFLLEAEGRTAAGAEEEEVLGVIGGEPSKHFRLGG